VDLYSDNYFDGDGHPDTNANADSEFDADGSRGD
jgi:hypothetical protein